MQVEHGLTGSDSAVDHRAEVLQTLLLRHFGCHQQQVSQQRLMVRSSRTQALDRLTGDHQHMHRRLGSDVPKGQAVLVAVNLIAGDLAPQDLSEDRVVRHGARRRTAGSGVTGGAFTPWINPLL